MPIDRGRLSRDFVEFVHCCFFLALSMLAHAGPAVFKTMPYGAITLIK